MIFSKKKEEIGNLSLLIDIQSSVVHGALILSAPDQVSGIQWMMNIDIPHKDTHSSAQYIKVTAEAIKLVVSSANKYVLDTFKKASLPKNISQVHLVLSSPWIISRARTISHKFAKITQIDQSHISNIIMDERKKLEENDQFVSVEEKVCDVRLNGYSVIEWQNNEAHTLEISFTLGLTSSQVYKNFKNAVSSSIHNCGISFHSALLLQHAHIQRTSPHETPYLLVHAHGELTDVVVADQYAYRFFATYPIGIKTIIRNIAKKIGISDVVAESLITMHNSGQRDNIHDKKNLEIIEHEFAIWADHIKGLLSNTPNENMPKHAFVSAHANGEMFCNALSKIKHNIEIELVTEKTPGTVVYTSAIRHLENL